MGLQVAAGENNLAKLNEASLKAKVDKADSELVDAKKTIAQLQERQKAEMRKAMKKSKRGKEKKPKEFGDVELPVSNFANKRDIGLDMYSGAHPDPSEISNPLAGGKPAVSLSAHKSEKVPDGWRKHRDPKTGKEYYSNSQSKRVTWNDPSSPKVK